MAGRAGRAASSALARSTERPAGLALGLLVGLWVVVIYDPPWLLAAHGLTPALKSRLLLNLGVMASLAIGVASVPAWARRWEWNAPLLALILFMSTHMLFAINPGVVWWWVQEWGLMWMLMAATFVVLIIIKVIQIIINTNKYAFQ